MLRFGGRRGCRGFTDGVVSPKSADHVNLGELVGKGVAQIGRSSVEWFDTFGGYVAGLGASSLYDYQTRLELWVFSADPSLVRDQVYHHSHSVLHCYCLTLLLKLDLQLSYSHCRLPYYLVCFWSGVGLTLMTLYRDRSYFPEILPSALYEIV